MSIKIINNHTYTKKDRVEGVDHPHRYSGPGDIAVLPPIFYSEEYTFFGQRPGGSWQGNDAFVVTWIWERLRAVLVVALAFVTVIFVARRVRIKKVKTMAYRKLSYWHKYLVLLRVYGTDSSRH